MRKASRVDRNHPEIVKALRKAGASVQSLCAVRDGCPDLLVGYGSKNFLMEVKDGSLPPSGRKLTPDEQLWFAGWRGKVFVVQTVEDALRVIQEDPRFL